ncbi:MAG: FAD-dependent thymidylate synthase [Clostridia bacterium]|nr:FAD-dependent thymidylate synthase [Clostridia bacterium]MDQ7792585.1 FAD-dependent thymidylate synthase [Clostridia bacterium]
MGQKTLKVTLLQHTAEPERLAALAGKRCYSGLDNENLVRDAREKDPAKFISKVVGMGHVTIIEHASFTFAVEGVSRSLLAQITRHRLASFSVQSQRYVGETASGNSDGVFDYIVPSSIARLGPDRVAEFARQMAQIQEWYDGWVQDFGGGRDAFEDARFVLPNAAETKFLLTMNARELLHLFTLRCCVRAQWEIQALADGMLSLVREVAPTIFAKAGPACLRGPCPEGDLNCGKMKEVREKYRHSAE